MNKILINEVGPRDGLQNIETVLSVEQKHSLIKSLEKSGIESIEIGSFVSEKAVPAMKGTIELVQGLGDLSTYSVLVPNMFGYQLAKKNKVRELRKLKCLTQEQLAEVIGVSRQTINAIEKEKFDPSLPTAFKMSKLFELPIEDFFLFGEIE